MSSENRDDRSALAEEAPAKGNLKVRRFALSLAAKINLIVIASIVLYAVEGPVG